MMSRSVFLLHKETMKENYSLEQIIKECVKEEEEMFWQRIKIQTWEQRKQKERKHYFDRTEHDWIASQENGKYDTP